MKFLAIVMTTLIFSASLSAEDLSAKAQVFHERMMQRSPLFYEGASLELIGELPEVVEEVVSLHFDSLIHFATQLDLFSQGFSYHLNDEVYQVESQDNETVAYTFSITILKDGALKSVGMYELMRRVDGVFFLVNDPSWY